jgi:hypothetical protein
MKIRKLKKENTAVAGVIEALLLVALVAVILSYIQFTYIPVVMEEREADHMDVVSNQFSQLKSVIEIQAMMGILGTGEAITYTPMSTPITMGSKELPYFVSARSYGQLDLVDQNDAGNHKINIQPAPADFPMGIPLTSIKYHATNFYYPSDSTWQDYILEGGGIILKQSSGEVMRVNPSISVENHSDLGYIKINYFIPLYSGIAGKKIHADYRDSYVHTNYTNDYTHSGAATFVHIYTDYPNAWYQSLVNESSGILWPYYDNGYINVEIDTGPNPDRVEITPGSKTIQLELSIVELTVQVGPGLVINT